MENDAGYHVGTRRVSERADDSWAWERDGGRNLDLRSGVARSALAPCGRFRYLIMARKMVGTILGIE